MAGRFKRCLFNYWYYNRSPYSNIFYSEFCKVSNSNIIDQETNSEDFLNAFDLVKFLHTVKKSLIWVVLLFIVAGTGAFLFVRYTKPLFESQSLLKLDIESEATSLGLASANYESAALNNLSGEIELLKSKLFFSKVISVANLDVSYHYYGRYLTDERYKNSPFVVSYKLHNGSYYNRSFDLEIFDENQFNLIYDRNGELVSETFRYGEEISTSDFNLLIEKTKNFNFPEVSGTYFFVINSEDALINYFQNNVKVTPENLNARTIRISLSDHNKYKARDLVMAIDTLYLEYTKQAKNQTIDQKIKFLDSQINETEEKIEGFEEYFEDFIVDNRTTNYQTEIAKTIQVLNVLDTTEFQLKKEISEIDLILSENNDELLNVSPLLINKLPEVVATYLMSYQELLKEKQNKIRNYNENTYVIRRLNEELESEREKFAGILGDYKEDLISRLGDLKRRRDLIEGSFSNMPSMSTDFNKNQRFYALQENFLLNLTKSKMELEITKAGTVTNFVVLSPASLPSVPIEPKPLLIYGGAIALAFFLSLFLILIRYLMNNRITTLKELEGLISVPVLGTLPKYRGEKLVLTKLVVRQNSKSALSEALRTIRTNMEFLNGPKKNQLLTITSTISGEGKTFVAVNLGAIIALSNQKVCIVDLDMRKPKVHLAFGDEPHYKGMSTLLIGKDQLDDCIISTETKGLDYIPAGPTPPNPSELILNEEYRVILEDLRSRYDLVILDTPPVGLVTDAVLSMKLSDLQMYV
ncbi:MAG: tyrosine protein kinase [Flammeovirgaceae bacterium]|nr:tyrosine protein kinase [Flammeovirgaceae bacterium]